jgi:hypothetical protein
MKKKNVLGLFLAAIVTMGAFAQSESDFTISTMDGKVAITGYTGSTTAVVIPATIGEKPVVAIGESAFADNSNITSVTMHSGITIIGASAFISCNNLTQIIFPNTLVTIERVAFANCVSLPAIQFPDTLETIGDQAFWDCNKLTRINYPINIKHIGKYAFGGMTRYALYNNLDVTIRDAIIAHFGGEVFEDTR